VPRWGYQGRNKASEKEWLVEVPEKDWKNETDAGKNVRTVPRHERVERIRRNERKMRANERRARRTGA
jgi:regulator of ribosome biosynthesis